MDFYDKCRGAFFRPGGFKLTKRSLEYCCLEEGAVIADIGCGTGGASRYIEEIFPIKVINIEPSLAMADGELGIINASAESTPFESNFLDGVLCECVLSLCDDIKAALDEMYRITKPRGNLIISDIYSKSEYADASGAFRRLYPIESYLSFIRDSGFEIILFEDHTRELAIMKAQLIMDGADCEAIISGLPNEKSIGYFLIIAQKL